MDKDVYILELWGLLPFPPSKGTWFHVTEAIEHSPNGRYHRVIYYHCELNHIEHYWCNCKHHARFECEYTVFANNILSSLLWQVCRITQSWQTIQWPRTHLNGHTLSSDGDATTTAYLFNPFYRFIYMHFTVIL